MKKNLACDKCKEKRKNKRMKNERKEKKRKIVKLENHRQTNNLQRNLCSPLKRNANKFLAN